MKKLKENLRLLLIKRNISKSELGRQLGISRQTMTTKLSKDNYNLKELIELSNILNCDIEVSFILKDTGERLTASTEG